MRLPLSFVVLDLDDVLFPHWDGLDDAIWSCIETSVFEHLAKTRQSFDKDEVRALMRRSYQAHGSGLAALAGRYGIDSVAPLHRDYHSRLLASHVAPQFNSKTAAFQPFFMQLRRNIAALAEAGVKLSLLTPGDNQWAQAVPDLIGVGQHIPYRRGVDAFGMRLKSQTNDLYRDFLKAAGYLHAFESAMVIDDRRENLRMANAYGMRTVWITGPKPADEPQDWFGDEQRFPDINAALREILLEVRGRQFDKALGARPKVA